MEYKLTEGKISKALIVFSLPMILGNALQQLYNIADTLIVGKTLGANALSAVGSSYALMVLLTSIIMGLCMGSGVVFSHFFGAGKKDEMKVSIFNSFFFILIVSSIICALSFACLDDFIVWLKVPAQAAEFTKDYLKIIFIGTIFVSVYNFFASVLRSVGNTVVPLIYLAVSAVTNIALDLVFIIVFKMGVSGAALATVISQALSALCIAVHFFVFKRNFAPKRAHMKLNFSLLKLIMNNSVLTSVQQSIMNFGILMVQGLVNSFGIYASAAFAAVVKIDAFAYMPAQDFGNAFSTYIAQNFGAKKHKRIYEGTFTAVKISSLFCLVSSAFVCLFAKQLMLLFVDSSQTEIIKIGVEYLHIEGAFYIGIGILFLLYGLFRGLGKSGVSIVLTVISLGSRVVLAYVLSSVPQIGMTGIWWAVPIGWALADITGFIIYFFSKKESHI